MASRTFGVQDGLEKLWPLVNAAGHAHLPLTLTPDQLADVGSFMLIAAAAERVLDDETMRKVLDESYVLGKAILPLGGKIPPQPEPGSCARS